MLPVWSVCTPVRALPNVGANAVTAVPVCPLTPFTTLVDVVLRLAPVRNDPGVVCTPVQRWKMSALRPTRP